MKSILLIIAILLTGNQVYGQTTRPSVFKIIDGDWRPQSQTQSCWAATLSNVSRPKWNNDTIPESFFWNSWSSPIPSLIKLSEQASVKYKFNIAKDDNILTWPAIGKIISQSSPRPIVYSFKIEGDVLYHFVNLIGYEKINQIDPRVSNWIYVYDPLPMKKGSRYLKNYLTYQLINRSYLRDGLQGTIYQFDSANTRRLPHLPSATTKAVFTDSFRQCVKKTEVQNLIKTIFDSNTSSDFKTVAGLKSGPLWVTNSPVLTGSLDEQHIPSLTPDRRIVQLYLQNMESEIIPFLTKANNAWVFKTGVVIRNTGTDCWVIDILKDMSFLDPLTDLIGLESESIGPFPSVTLRAGIRVVNDNDNNRFIEIERDGQFQYYDIDGFLDKTPQLYNQERFFENFMKIKFPAIQNDVRILNIPDNWRDQQGINLGLPANLKVSELQHTEFVKRNVRKVLLGTKIQ